MWNALVLNFILESATYFRWLFVDIRIVKCRSNFRNLPRSNSQPQWGMSWQIEALYKIVLLVIDIDILGSSMHVSVHST